MRILLLLFVLSNPIFINACLKIQLLPPPSCACDAIAIKPAELRLEYAMWYDAPFWGGVPETLLRQPILIVDDCYAQMSCEGDAELFIFDKGPDRNFGAYSAEGFCDPYTQTWSVTDPKNEFITINLLYGICLLSTEHCSCQSLALQPSNIWENIPEGHPYYRNITLNQIKAPVIAVDDCAISMYCEGDYNLMIIDSDIGYKFGEYSADGFCDASTQTWSVYGVNGEVLTISNMRGVCVTNSKCPCASLELTNENAQYYIGKDTYYQNTLRHYSFFPANLTYTEDGCQHTRKCSEGLSIITYVNTHTYPGDWAPSRNYSFSWGSTCSTSERWPWRLQQSVTITRTEFLAPICVDYSKRID